MIIELEEQSTDILQNSLKYMLNNANMEKIEKQDKGKIIKIEKENSKRKFRNYSDFFYFKDKDSLFWCFYGILHGIDNYFEIKNKFVEEKNCKINFIEQLRQEKHIFKTNKISRPTVEGELSSDLKITMKSIKALAFLKQKNILYIDNKKYYEIFPNVENDYYCIEKKDYLYGFKKIDLEKLEFYKNNYWKLESLDKPLKAISSYKVSELKEICDKLHIQYKTESGKTFTKQGLYNLILEKI